MIVPIQMLVTDVKKKVSGQGNVYYLLDLLETTEFKDEKDQFIKREWCRLYYSPASQDADIVNHKDKILKVYLSFFPVQRKVGENVYNEIKCSITALEAL